MNNNIVQLTSSELKRVIEENYIKDVNTHVIVNNRKEYNILESIANNEKLTRLAKDSHWDTHIRDYNNRSIDNPAIIILYNERSMEWANKNYWDETIPSISQYYMIREQRKDPLGLLSIV